MLNLDIRRAVLPAVFCLYWDLKEHHINPDFSWENCKDSGTGRKSIRVMFGWIPLGKKNLYVPKTSLRCGGHVLRLTTGLSASSKSLFFVRPLLYCIYFFACFFLPSHSISICLFLLLVLFTMNLHYRPSRSCFIPERLQVVEWFGGIMFNSMVDSSSHWCLWALSR